MKTEFSFEYKYIIMQTNDENKENFQLWADPKTNYLNENHKNCMADSK